MKKLSFDWNCAISVENNEASSTYIRRLVELHQSGTVDVGILQTSASENMMGIKGFPGSYQAFEERLCGLGWENLPRVATPGVWRLTFWGHSTWVDSGRYERLSAELWAAICPGVSRDVCDFIVANGLPKETDIGSPALAKWRNWWCDVHSAYAHVDAKRDLFVTTNVRDFQRKSKSLLALGLRAVTPKEALAALLS